MLVLQVLEIRGSPLPDHFLMVQFRERPVKLQVHMLSDNSLFVDTAQHGHLFDLSLEQGHGGAPLEPLHRVENLIAQRLADALHELLHLLLGVHKVIDVEVEVLVQEEAVVLR